MIELGQLRKAYNQTAALDGFSLSVEDGELFGLVGPNGAGKSTLIKILATLVRPNAGSAHVDGIDVLEQPRTARMRIGYLPDVAGLYQDMRVLEFLEFFADAFRLHGEERKSAVAEALERSGLSSRANSFVEELSLGMKQRLLLAKTLLHKPKVLLLDEPATGLDPLARIDLRQLLKQLNRKGTTILISSHILSDLEDICTRVAFIARGRNAVDAQGRTVLTIGGAAPENMSCEFEVGREPERAAAVIAGFNGARVISTNGMRLRVELTGGAEQTSALLQCVLAAGIPIVQFDSRGPGLEERYRQVFGAEVR